MKFSTKMIETMAGIISGFSSKSDNEEGKDKLREIGIKTGLVEYYGLNFREKQVVVSNKSGSAAQQVAI